MYWIDISTRKIQRATLSGAGVQDLVTIGLVSPAGIALDPYAGKMYWTDYDSSTIQRADLTGANVETLVETGLIEPNGIVLSGDGDGDGVPNALDNCPTASNTSQTNADASNGVLNRPGADGLGDACDFDADGDGYPDVIESALGKDPLAYCAIMRANVDLANVGGDHAVTILDMTLLAQHFLEPVPPAPERYNQDADNAITILDLTVLANLFLDNVSACP